MRNVPPGIHVIRGLVGRCHLLTDGEVCHIIDTGLVGEMFIIRRLMRKLGYAPDALKTILLTHGHLDHTGNLATLKAWTGVKILAHPTEQQHINGTYPYTGTAKWCGRLEAFGRFCLNYCPAVIDEFISDGQELPIWGGLRVIHLPGHTVGHCGFYSARHDLLFSGDFFATYFGSAWTPLPIFNSVPEQFPASADKIRRLNPRLIIPNHYLGLDAAKNRKRFDHLFGGGR